MLLQEEASGVSHFSTNAIEPFGSEEVSMLQVLEKLLTSQKAEEHRPLLTWIIQKLLAVQQSYMGTPVDAEGTVHLCVHAYMHTYIHTVHVHTCICTIQVYTYIHTYSTCTCMHTYIVVELLLYHTSVLESHM